MRAIGLTTFGGPEVLHPLDLPAAHPGRGEVRIRVHSAAVNPTDLSLRSGALKALLPDLEPPYIPGMDAAGTVDALGTDTGTRLAVGDAVIAFVQPAGPHKGAYAEQIVVPEASVVHAPENIELPAASTLLLNSLTARLAVDSLGLRPGESIGVTGASGAVGGYAVQLAKADGLHVVAESGADDQELVRRMGADVIVERGDHVSAAIRAAVPDGVGGLVDAADQNEATLPAIRDHGALAVLRGWDGPTERGIALHKIVGLSAAGDTARLERLRDQAQDGTLTLRVAGILPADRAADAHRRVAAGGLRGRLVLDFT